MVIKTCCLKTTRVHIDIRRKMLIDDRRQNFQKNILPCQSMSTWNRDTTTQILKPVSKKSGI